jgi:hypothetical protein
MNTNSPHSDTRCWSDTAAVSGGARPYTPQGAIARGVDSIASPKLATTGAQRPNLDQGNANRISGTHTAMQVGPAARHQPLVPAQQRPRTDRESRPGPTRQRPTQRSQEQPVRLSQLRPPPLPAQDRELVPQHQDLQLLRPRRPTTEHHQPEQTANDHVRKRPQHAPPPPDGEADATRPQPYRPP